MSYVQTGEDIASEVTEALMRFNSESSAILEVAQWMRLGEKIATIKGDAEEWHAHAMIFTKIVDNFNTYLVEILLIVLTEYPMAFGNRKIELKHLFQTDSLEDLKRRSIEQQVNGLSYSSLRDTNDFLVKNLGVNMFPNRLMMGRLSYIQTLRNIIVHNRGYVSTYVEGRLSSRYCLGEKIDIPHILRTLKYLFHCVKHMDRAFTAKFELRSARLYVRADA